MAQMLIRVTKEMDEALNFIDKRHEHHERTFEQYEAFYHDLQKSYSIVLKGVYDQWKEKE